MPVSFFTSTIAPPWHSHTMPPGVGGAGGVGGDGGAGGAGDGGVGGGVGVWFRGNRVGLSLRGVVGMCNRTSA